MAQTRGLYDKLSKEVGFKLENPAFKIFLPNKKYAQSLILKKNIIKIIIRSFLILITTLLLSIITYLINDTWGMILFIPYLVIVSILATIFLMKISWFKESSYVYRIDIMKAEEYYKLIEMLKKYKTKIKEAFVDDKGNLCVLINDDAKIIITYHKYHYTFSHKYELMMNINKPYAQQINLEHEIDSNLSPELKDVLIKLKETKFVKDAIDDYFLPNIVIKNNTLSIKGELAEQHKIDDHKKLFEFLLSTMEFLRDNKL